jgi:hypothetical protein
MQLWNDYEGKTIADVYPLGALLRPEGRSALFALRDGAEAPAIIRLTEALNDESQMLSCWRRVTEVKQENLVKIKRFGQTNFEGTPLTYAVMELTDANLADLLKERPLTYPEAMQVATSVAAALTALHAKGFVHEHIDAANVLAAGETVKLRTDCVRECIVDSEHVTAAEYEELVQRDVHDLSTLLLRSLTLERKLSPTSKLPAPFNTIVPNGMNGVWGLPEISAALKPQTVKLPVPQNVAKPVDVTLRPQPVAASQSQSAPASRQESVPVQADLRYDQRRLDVDDDETGSNTRRGLWAACAFVVILMLALSLHFFKGGSNQTPAPEPMATESPVPQSAVPSTAGETGGNQVVSPKPANSKIAPIASSNNVPAIAAHMQPGWYVIAYTFNHEDQAWKRAAAIMKQHPALHAEVIAPAGHAPFLVAIGGAMSRDEAESVRNRARHAGMPRDTFMRNYKGN